MKKINKIFFIIGAMAFLHSCDDDQGYSDYDAGGTTTQELAGEWFVETFDSTGAQAQGYVLWSTYNTAANDGTLWVDDDGHTLGVKTKALTSGLTFSATNSENISSTTGGTATITNGEVFKAAATTTGGNTADSIYFNIEDSSDPGVIYEVRGYKRTGFDEDEH